MSPPTGGGATFILGCSSNVRKGVGGTIWTEDSSALPPPGAARIPRSRASCTSVSSVGSSTGAVL
jgi:hypothetical protein